MFNVDVCNNFTDLMLDVETLGRDGKFVVTSVSFVPFCLKSDFALISDDYIFMESISVSDSIKRNFRINRDTIEWWLATDAGMFKNQLNSEITVPEFCAHLEFYLLHFPNIERVWATAVIDYQAISNLFEECGKDNPIPYFKRLCARTMSVFSKDILGQLKAPKGINDHNPVNDCLNQIAELKEDYGNLCKLKM